MKSLELTDAEFNKIIKDRENSLRLIEIRRTQKNLAVIFAECAKAYAEHLREEDNCSGWSEFVNCTQFLDESPIHSEIITALKKGFYEKIKDQCTFNSFEAEAKAIYHDAKKKQDNATR